MSFLSIEKPQGQLPPQLFGPKSQNGFALVRSKSSFLNKTFMTQNDDGNARSKLLFRTKKYYKVLKFILRTGLELLDFSGRCYFFSGHWFMIIAMGIDLTLRDPFHPNYPFADGLDTGNLPNYNIIFTKGQMMYNCYNNTRFDVAYD